MWIQYGDIRHKNPEIMEIPLTRKQLLNGTPWVEGNCAPYMGNVFYILVLNDVKNAIHSHNVHTYTQTFYVHRLLSSLGRWFVKAVVSAAMASRLAEVDKNGNYSK